MRTKVTEQGLVIPKELLEGVEEVEIRREESNLIVTLIFSETDPIYELGKHPVTEDVTDASINHDRYLYDQ